MRLPLKITLAWLLVFFLMVPNIYAIDGVYHSPFGTDDLYEIQATERSPRDPVAGDAVFVKITTWPIESGQSVWLTWTKNGVSQPNIGAAYKYNNGNNTYWEASLGTFAKGDVIAYTVRANKDGANEKTSDPFTFTVTGWESVSSISSVTNNTNRVVLNAVPNTGSMTPKINLSFTADDVFRVQVSPTGTGSLTGGLSNYTLTDSSTAAWISTSKLKIKVDKNPFRLSVYKPDGTTLIARQYDSTVNRNLSWLTNGSSIITKMADHFTSPASEEFFGFGERYNNFRKRGTDVDTYVFNQYKNQNDRTYMPIPFMLNSSGYGIFVNSTYYSKFRLATERPDMYSFTADTGGSANSTLDYYFIYGNDLKGVVSNYTGITGKPAAIPKWALGLWMSANEWDRQSEVASAISTANANNIPATAIVLEQWSDENTFYMFNDAQYSAKPGGSTHAYSDFIFPAAGRWPNPKQMADNVHNNGMKLVLWQVPIQKWTAATHQQKANDEAYMIAQNYAVGDGSGGQYRIPAGQWFENSLLLDFTNAAAKNWWMSKRAYLFDGIGIDGFKTDGGEMVWGRGNTFANGKKGDEMRNQYPNEYVKAYNDYARSKKSDAVSFSRSGTQGAQGNQIFWSGDQESTFGAFQQALNAGLTAGMSGVPFWSWDLAGFTGTYPSAELFKRSTAMSAFTPIMQFHSESNGSSGINEERSPWNAQARTGDNTIMGHFAKYTNTRMNLLPYLYTEAKGSSDTGVPMMRAMALEYPADSNTYGLNQQYMLGGNLLVAPVMNQGETSKSVYLPQGDWIDFWYGAQRPGGRTINYNAGIDDLPVFVKAGSILPMNLNGQYQLGGTIGNSLTTYNNLTFRVYPLGTTTYDWNDDIGGSVKTITSTEQFAANKVTVSVPAINSTKTLQVYTTKPASVTLGGTAMTAHNTLTALTGAPSGWFYDTVQKLTYVKLAASASAQSVVLDGVNKAEYEAEFGTLSGVTTNSNHAGFTGTGFVDGFETSGESVSFDVSVKSAGTYALKVRYTAGTSAATRAIYANNVKVTDLALPKTTDWGTWSTATLNVTLNAGLNTVRVNYDGSNAAGINLDNISVVEQ
ncbi:glycoside hydrolase family 31 [Paenibacillus herberti]|uniref:Glycoside hydrolase family 31 n=2 Tax=Paenibacillus herberti TaxID=1619309 RepID=A0A229NZH0_9BACL|nr:glycoside hydrolase family 31 [Paenibacillus herberti]